MKSLLTLDVKYPSFQRWFSLSRNRARLHAIESNQKECSHDKLPSYDRIIWQRNIYLGSLYIFRSLWEVWYLVIMTKYVTLNLIFKVLIRSFPPFNKKLRCFFGGVFCGHGCSIVGQKAFTWSSFFLNSDWAFSLILMGVKRLRVNTSSDSSLNWPEQ